MPSAFAASGDITDSIVYLSLGDDGSGDLQLQAYGPGGEVLSPTAPVRVPSSNAYEIPAGQDRTGPGLVKQTRVVGDFLQKSSLALRFRPFRGTRMFSMMIMVIRLVCQ